MDLQNGNIGDANEESGNKKAIYSIPGILHFIQHEWSRFEIDRAQWDVERAELQARIAFLQGERKGQENLKRDLIRRIKMLEYALKQERAKVHKYKFGTDLKVDPKPVDSDDSRSSGGDVSLTQPNMTWRHGRQLLRQYLQEVGYSDTILDVRSQRVRALLGSTYDVNNKDNDSKMINGDSPVRDKQKSPDFSPQEKGEPTEGDVMREFNFLTAVEDDEEGGYDEIDSGDQQRTSRPPKMAFDTNDKFNGAELALAEFAFLNHEEQETADPKAMDWSVDQDKLNAMKEQFRHEKRQTKRKGMKRPDKKNLKSMIDTLRGAEMGVDDSHLGADENLSFSGPRGGDGSIESSFGLGELAGLTVANEADPLSFEISGNKEAHRRTWQPKFTLRSHFDGVRAVRFLLSDAALLTGSEDHTLKLWNLNKTLAGRRGQAHDMEPVYCFRGHTGPVLCLALDSRGSVCFSAGADTTIRCWNIPNIDIDLYDSYDASVEGQTMIGHTDAVWSLSYCGPRQHLLSASSDMTLKLWDPQSHDPLLQTISVKGDATPTCAEFVRCDSNQVVVSHSDGRIVLLDLNTGKTSLTLTEGDGSRVSCVASHPTMPVTISAHDDGHIKFFDNLTGKMTHSMVAHLDSVSSLAVDPSGLYLLSGSHDCSIRLWSLDNKTCVQELTAHRRKFDEAIHSVAFHANASLIASGGADSLAKVFV